MSKIHVLATNGGANRYLVVVHDATPGTSNSAGVLWSDAVKNSGRAVTIMTEGAGAGQITTAEKTSVLAGTILEGSFDFQDDPSWSGAQRNAALDLRATNCVTELQARLSKELKWFGAVRA